MTARRVAPLISPSLYGDPTAPTPSSGDDDLSIATTEFVTDAITDAITATGSSTERAILLGRGGTIGNAADCADFPVSVPFTCTLVRMKATVKSAPSGAMVVQLRNKTAPVTTPPTYSDVTGFACTFTAGRVLAVVDPANVALTEGDMLNFSLTVADGANVTVEAIVTVP